MIKMIQAFSNIYNQQDMIRDAMAARSNLMALTDRGAQAERAATFYNDWDVVSDRDDIPSNARMRRGVVYMFHTRLGKWVPVLKEFNWSHDMHDWLLANATNSSTDRDIYYKRWKSVSRKIRAKTPYSIYPVHDIGMRDDVAKNMKSSIIVRNINNSMMEADIAMAFSVFGPIIDCYRPVRFNQEGMATNKVAFYIFIEYMYPESADAAINAFTGVEGHIFMDFPIYIERAGSRRTREEMMKN